MNPTDRRTALKTLGAAALSAALPARAAVSKAKTPLVGIQLGLKDLMDRGIGTALDEMKELGAVNALFPFINTHVHSYAGFPKDGFVGGNFAKPDPKYYKDSFLPPEKLRAPEAGDVDYLQTIIDGGAERGMKTFAWICEVNRLPPAPEFAEVWEVGLDGEITLGHPAGFCHRNPRFRAWQLGLIEDYCRNYDIAGVMWGSERQGPISNALGAYHWGNRSDPFKVTCFCDHCLEEGRQRGLDPDAVKEAYTDFARFVASGRAGEKPNDGYFVEFMRHLFERPELVAWNKLWHDGYFGLMADSHAKVKSVNPSLLFGWHVWQNSTFHPFHQADIDYRALSKINDFFKPAIYQHVAGKRMQEYIESTSQNWLGDFPPAEAAGIALRMLGYEEGPYDQLAERGFSIDYVTREVKRILHALEGTDTKLWPGIDVDVRWPGAKLAKPEEIRASIRAALVAGAHGVVHSRIHTEMKPESLKAAGDGVRDFLATTWEP